ncbi:uncharacterized protein NFIA_044920 [Aspergillus fischeri NRRL 181]|uniref:Uncharacterized protein n=1 Tax=Neosartorya fischeri (strain ATCC 1020 / DSM 3700 / CBS 544.65 / FGSC A1164 / JCM 1740 / NRRL 181 / WB 181) TaxID=331117 RepID=A1CV96_NEOFI|nr:conserved hypothetical protein [Aspergillus fischeri NRRL 181]EAW25673.1 conserved hypothetical protein [Aspergillus fischeri NRRL 181]
MTSLTVAEASGLIAAGVFILQLLLPLSLPLILVAFLTDENSIISWNVLARFLHSTLWPSILGSSTAAISGVQKRLTIAGNAQTIILGVVSIASIVTPLGLYDSIEPAGSPTPEPFAYIKGTSAFSYGTPDRTDAPFTRNCGLQQACPGTSLNKTCRQQGLLENCNVVYDSLIPEQWADVFREGASAFGPSVSSIFDMQYRTFFNATDQYSVLGWYAKPSYRSLQVLILDEKVEPVEGLIVDMVDGGIGFRNHTAPAKALKYGSTWDEDILFIQPETQCVPLNFSIEFQLPPVLETSLSVVNLVLKDHGGLSNLAGARPSISVPVNGQEFDLRQRAWNAAWYNNFLTLAYFNATDPDPTNITRIDVTPGDTFKLQNANFTLGYRNIKTTISLGEYLNLHISNSTVNPHNINLKDFDLGTTLCGGTTSSSPSTITSALIGCGLVYGAANRTDGVSPLRTDPNSPWSIPLYICASAVKASLKTVSFRYNGTGLDGLSITSLSQKTYPSPPLWAVEDLPDRTLEEVQPLWGILPSNTTSPEPAVNLSTIASTSLYLPGYIDPTTTPFTGLAPVPVSTGQNLPGVDFYTQALYRALSISRPAGQPFADYAGWTSLALYAKWQTLSTTAAGAAKILDLVWTDFAANAMVGTRAVAEHNQVRPVTVFERRIRYRLPYAVPGIVVLAATLGIVAGLVVLGCMRRTGISRLKGFLEKTAVGRVLGLVLLGEEEEMGMDWVSKVGGKRVKITDEGITVQEGLLSPETKSDGHENDSAEVEDIENS